MGAGRTSSTPLVTLVPFLLVLLDCLRWCAVSQVSALPNGVKIGVVIAEDDDELERDIFHTLESVNHNDTILPYSRLLARVIKIKREDKFHAMKAVCHLASEGIVALVGSPSPTVNYLLQSAGQSMRLPHLETEESFRSPVVNYSVNLFPDPAIYSKALMDLVAAKAWKSFLVMYEDHEGILKVQDLYNSGYKVRLRRISHDDNLRKILKELGQQGETHIILDIAIEKVITVFHAAQDLGMLTEYHNYIVTSLDFHTAPMEDFRHGLSNISGFHFLQGTRYESEFSANQRSERTRYGSSSGGSRLRKFPSFRTATAVLFDTLNLLARALHDLDNSQTLHEEKLSCNQNRPWTQGKSVVNYMKMINIVGTTGIVKLDEYGRRVDFVLDVLELKKKGLTKVGSWNIRTGLTYLFPKTGIYNDVLQSLRNKTLRVTTLISPPYTMVKENEDLMGNSRFHGFCVDLLQKLSEQLGFRYEIRLVRDNNYGNLEERGEWNGMIRELIDRDADLAVADVTITYQREEVVDFTMPFMNLGISILFRKPKRREKNPFIFFSSLSIDVWFFTLGAYILASMMLYVTARFSPNEWVPERRAIKPGGRQVLINNFGFANSMWFMLSSIMRQGSSVTPRSLSTRLAALSWWFFTLIMISSYTANFAAFLTVERLKLPIEKVEDLAKQTKIQYGCVSSGSTCAFFENSEIEMYKGMWEFMKQSQPTAFTNSNLEGVDRVLNENYAFLMESTSIEYITERNCRLTQVGGLLDSKGYGIAMPQGSPYTSIFSSMILRLQEDGSLAALKNKWWKKKEGEKCDPMEINTTRTADELGLYNVGGIFVVLLTGLGLSCVSVIIEIIIKYRRRSARNRQT